MKYFKILALTFFLAVPLQSGAAEIFYHDHDYINSTPDSDNDDFADISNIKSYSQIILDVKAQGDLGRQSGEYIDLNFNGHEFVRFNYANLFSLGSQTDRFVDGVLAADMNNEIRRDVSYYVSFSLLIDADALVKDIFDYHGGVLDLGWHTGDGVNHDLHHAPKSYIELKLTGISDVPEPSVILLFGTGLLGLALVRRRKQAGQVA